MAYDILALSLSYCLILIYYLYLNRRTCFAPDTNAHTLNTKIREQWVAMVMGNGKKDILAIQTLRNSVMAASFMASTSVLLIIGTLNLSEKIGQWAQVWHPNSLGYQVSHELWQIKLGLLLLDFSIAFFCFTMSIRLFNHVGYMINLPNDLSKDTTPYKLTCAYLKRAGHYYMLGTRTFFFSLPIILWFLGPYFLLLATVILIAGLAMLDKVPS